MTQISVEKLYKDRFSEADREGKDRIWRVLCDSFFQRMIGEDKVIVDLACGYGEFINHIRGTKRFGVDINSETAQFLERDVSFIHSPATDLRALPAQDVDIIFTSNFFEHLPDKNTLSAVLSESYRVLKPGGKLIAMGPNIRFTYADYWNFYDHHLPLSDQSLKEALELADFQVEKSIAKFLPFSTKSALPQHPLLVALYLKVPLAWPILGKQFLLVARKPA